MRYRKTLFTIFILGIMVHFINAQVSLWQSQTPFGSNLEAGGLVEVNIKEVFRVNINSKWNLSNKIELNLLPDTKNLPFLSPSTQNKNRNKNSQVKYRIQDELNFSVQAVIGIPQPGSRLYPIQASRVVVIDLKPTQITLSGLVHPKYIKNDRIHSKHIANLRLNVSTQPPFDRDASINLKPPRPEEIIDPLNPPAARAELSEQEKQQILLRHLQEIVGLLNQ